MLVMDTEGRPRVWIIPSDDPTGVRVGVPVAVEPLNVEVLAARRAVILFKRRMRRSAKPAYVNVDAVRGFPERDASGWTFVERLSGSGSRRDV